MWRGEKEWGKHILRKFMCRSAPAQTPFGSHPQHGVSRRFMWNESVNSNCKLEGGFLNNMRKLKVTSRNDKVFPNAYAFLSWIYGRRSRLALEIKLEHSRMSPEKTYLITNIPFRSKVPFPLSCLAYVLAKPCDALLTPQGSRFIRWNMRKVLRTVDKKFMGLRAKMFFGCLEATSARRTEV